MGDVVFLTVTVLFFLVSLAYAAYCDHLIPKEQVRVQVLDGELSGDDGRHRTAIAPSTQ